MVEAGEDGGGVGAEAGRGTADLHGRRAELGQDAELFGRARVGIGEVDHVAVVNRLGMPHPLLRSAEGLSGDVVLHEDAHPLVQVFFEERGEAEALEFAEVFHFGEDGLVGEALVLEGPVEPQLLQEVEQRLGREVAELDPVAVFRPAGHVGRDAAAVVAERPVELAAVVELPAEEVAQVEVHRRLEQTGLDALAAAAALADDEGGKDGLDGVERRAVAGEELGLVGGTVGAGGFVVGVHAAGDGVDDALVGADVGVGAGGAEAGEVGVDEAGVRAARPS